MSSNFSVTRPSFLEGGLPCASLSAECQRDNNARQRPPLGTGCTSGGRAGRHTISRAAVLSALLPCDLSLHKESDLTSRRLDMAFTGRKSMRIWPSHCCLNVPSRYRYKLLVEKVIFEPKCDQASESTPRSM